MQPNKKHIEFIRLVANGETQTEAYRVTCGNLKVTSKVAKVKGSQLAKRYAQEITEVKQKAQKVVELANESKEAKNALKAILTQAEVDATLSKIIRGEDECEKILVIGGKAQIIKTCKPDHSDKLKAIDLYNKRFGSNAPTKQEIKINKLGKDLEDELYEDKK